MILTAGFQWKIWNSFEQIICSYIKMFCGFKPELQNLSAPENIEEIKQKWNKDVLTYCIMNLTPKLTEETINQQIDSAFKVWKRNSALKFKKVKPNETIDIKISFCQREHGDGFPFKGTGGVLAHGFYPPRGDLHFDAEENWVDKKTPPGHNLFVVAVHEIGHCLGLNHSKNRDSVMFPSYKHELSDKLPHSILCEEDIIRIQTAYGKPRPKAKIFDDNNFSVKVKSVENNKIKLIIEKKTK